jgi:nucleoside-diphosphate-sugar epimerase
MRVLVTGGAGFIGSNLVTGLLERGDDVTVLDNFSTGHRRNVPADDVHLVEGDLRSYERVHHAVRGCEVVFHVAALPSVPRSIQDPLTTNDVNIGGTLNILLASRDEGVRRIVYASSSSVYGNAPGFPRHEGMPTAPLAPYPVSKLAAEQYCRTAALVYGIDTIALRYFNIFGRRQDPFSQYSAVIPRFITALRAGRAPLIHGDGEQSRDFTHVDNVVDANLRAAAAPEGGGAVLNIACGEPHSLNSLAATLNRLMGTSIEPEYQPERPGDVRLSHADVSAAEALIGYRPSVRLEEGLRRTIEDFEDVPVAPAIAAAP